MGRKIIRNELRRVIRSLSIAPYTRARMIVKRFIDKRKEKTLFFEQYNFFINNNVRFSEFGSRPFLDDKEKSPPFDRHYFYHPSWAARVLAETKPDKHVDISSILRFVGYISAFIPIDYYEYTVPDINLDNLTLNKVDLLHLPFDDNSIKSLSCMHVVEHVGLGRYGDNLDVDGDLKAIRELKRVLAVDGNLLFVVPISDKPRIGI